jgi:hypothetical protein
MRQQKSLRRVKKRTLRRRDKLQVRKELANRLGGAYSGCVTNSDRVRAAGSLVG